MNENTMQEDASNELAEMKHEIALLKEETLALKSKGKAHALRQRFVLGLAIVGVGVALMAHKGDTQTESGTVVCRELKVIDDNRNVVAWITSTRHREGNILIYNGARRKIVNISGSRETGEGGVWIADENGTNTASITSNYGKGRVWTKE